MYFDTDLFSELEDSNGEVFDVEYDDANEFDINEYLSADYDY